MWIGYNSKTAKMKTQIVKYLKNHDETSTNPAMVKETLRVTSNIAKECDQQYGITTYDLAIAKPVMQLQLLLSPTYDNLFINFGSFHILYLNELFLRHSDG